MKKMMLLALCILLTLSLLACTKEAPYIPRPTTQPSETETLPLSPTDPTAPTEPDDRFDPALCADVIGVWYREVDLDGKLMGVPDMDTMMRIRLVWTFGGNGIYTVAPENSYKEMIAEFELQLIDRLIESRRLIFVSEARLEGMSKKEANKLWEETEALVAEVECSKSVASLDLVGQFGKLTAAGTYYVEGEQIFMELDDGTWHTVTYGTATDQLVFRTSDHAQMYQAVGLSFPMMLVGTPSLPPLPTIPTLPSTAPTEPSTEITEPSEEPSEPSEDPSEPSEEPSEPSDDPSEPSEEPSEPSEEPSEPSEEPSEPSEDPSEPSEEIPEPSEEPEEPSEEPEITE